ncbi:MAG TPA: tyrosine-type recombinase/integrase [Pyrinomonadaceae bacterium]|nr:tyrosine-type recombinase/integrase [Pyrinomonadaceae bacterium]
MRKGGWEFKKPKSKNAVRDVPFPAKLYHDLMEFKQVQDEQKTIMGRDWHDHDLVFPSTNGNPMSPQSTETREFKPLLTKAGLGSHFTQYSLRYTYATLQMLSNERDKVISALMGHARVNFTQDVYQKVQPVMRERASDSMERMLFSESRTVFAQPDCNEVM